MAWSPHLPTYAFGNLPLLDSQWLDIDFHLLKSIVELIIVLPKQHYNNLKHNGQVAPDGVDRQSGLTYIGFLDFVQGPYSIIKYHFVAL
jgi:hypothetical protein